MGQDFESSVVEAFACWLEADGWIVRIGRRGFDDADIDATDNRIGSSLR
jgi:hypothetical protein